MKTASICNAMGGETTELNRSAKQILTAFGTLLASVFLLTVILNSTTLALNVPKGGATYEPPEGTGSVDIPITNGTGKTAHDVTVTITHTGGALPNISGLNDPNSSGDKVDDNNNGRLDAGETDNNLNPPGATGRLILGTQVNSGAQITLRITFSGGTQNGDKITIRYSRKQRNGQHVDLCADGHMQGMYCAVSIPIGTHLVGTDVFNETGLRLDNLYLSLMSPIPNHFNSCNVDCLYLNSFVKVRPDLISICAAPPFELFTFMELGIELAEQATDDSSTVLIVSAEPPWEPDYWTGLTNLGPDTVFSPGMISYRIEIGTIFPGTPRTLRIAVNEIFNVLGPITINIPLATSRDRNVNVGVGVTTGWYSMNAYIYDIEHWDIDYQDAFSFYVIGLSNAAMPCDPVLCFSDGGGEAFPEELTEATATPLALHLNASPNPCNAATVVRYSLPQAAMVKLTVYDLSGKRIALLVNEMQAAGEQIQSFDARELPSGLYVVRLETDSQATSQKLAIIK
ncbi:MAG: T9SS type A sorting domain-containing protein [bacterium]